MALQPQLTQLSVLRQQVSQAETRVEKAFKAVEEANSAWQKATDELTEAQAALASAEANAPVNAGATLSSDAKADIAAIFMQATQATAVLCRC